MGQYYAAINFDKRQKVLPGDYDNGAKLMGFSWQGNNYVGVVEHLLNNEWKGDRVLFIGDYAEDYIKYQKNWVEFEYIRYLTSLAGEFGTTDLYSIDAEALADISWQKPLRYIINDKAKSYIDRKEQPIQWSYEYEGKLVFAKIDPLSLVLVAGNGLGGGDYHGTDENLAGIWVDCAGFIRTADSVPEGYSYTDIIFSEYGNEFRKYDFGEYWECISETNLEIIKDMISKTGAALANADNLFLTGEELSELYKKEDKHGGK